VKSHLGFQFFNAGANFSDANLHLVKLSFYPSAPSQTEGSKRIRQDIRGTIQKHTKLIGFKPMARRAIGMQKSLMVFDIIAFALYYENTFYFSYTSVYDCIRSLSVSVFTGGFGGCITLKSMFSGFAELGCSLFEGVTQILHGRIDS
jgi:hypothetical protein